MELIFGNKNMTALVIAEHDNATLKVATLNAVTAALQCGGEVHVLVAGAHAGAVAAEAAKVIENTQRDLNIALVNELAIIFHKLGIDTSAVLEAAGTKWNFLPFHPGLV